MADQSSVTSKKFATKPLMLLPVPAAAEHSNSASAKHTPLQPHIPPTLTQPLSEDSDVIRYADKSEQENSKGLIIWRKNFRNSNKFGSLYEKVAVLLISWDPQSDDLDTAEEVDRLEHVWTDIFKYKVRRALLTTHGKLPQVQANHHISQFVWDEDSPRTLLIVYYAGHGTPGRNPGQLDLSGKRDHTMDVVANCVRWHLAEAALQGIEADVFEIFDCCYASEFRNGNFSERSFEYLAACSSRRITAVPGPNSFTSGLIWALTQLAKERDMFTTSELTNKIKEKPGFPFDQDPVLKERIGNASRKRIVLAPLSFDKPTDQASDRKRTNPSADRVILHLKFMFEDYPKARQLENMVKAVDVMVLDSDIVCDVKWGGMHAESEARQPVGINSPIIHEIIDKWRDVGNRRRSFSGASYAPDLAKSLAVPTLTTPNVGVAGGPMKDEDKVDGVGRLSASKGVAFISVAIVSFLIFLRT